ncbi:hypothetical protein ALC62_04504, partial [Cyphomyrmex costatus]
PSRYVVLNSPIVKSGIPDILEIKKIGRGKILIEVRSAAGANRLIENQIFPQNDLRAFIPAYKVLRTGIIQDVPQQIDLDTIKEGIESPKSAARQAVIDLQRLNRRIVRDNKVEYVPSRTLRVKFAGQLLPKEIFIFKVRHAVRPYVPLPRMCQSCFRIGHISKACKSSPRCLYCGEIKHNADCSNDAEWTCHMKDESPKCINCQGNHWANEIACPIIAKQKAIVSIAAIKNISIADVKYVFLTDLPLFVPLNLIT